MEAAKSLSPPASVEPLSNGEVALEWARVQAAISGDGKAFRALVAPHLGMLHRVATRACGNAALAEDAVQETLTVAWKQLPRYRRGSSLRAFLAAIAVRRAHTLLRAERRRRKREENAGHPTAQSSPEATLEAEQTARILRDALSALPKKRRAAALLRLDAGLGYPEIAESLGTSPASARVLVHLAQKQLRARLEEAGLLAGAETSR